MEGSGFGALGEAIPPTLHPAAHARPIPSAVRSRADRSTLERSGFDPELSRARHALTPPPHVRAYVHDAKRTYP